MHEIVYLILAHKNPEQVKRLIRKIASEHTYIYVHVDLNSNLNDFVEKKEQVFFVEERVPCSWGDFSIVEATLNCVRKIIEDKRQGHVILLSGQDYPIRSNDYIRFFFQKNHSYDFIDCQPIKEVWPQKYIYRVQAHKIKFSDVRNDFIYLPTIFTLRPRGIIKNALKLLARAITDKKRIHLKSLIKIFIKKCPPNNLIFFGGSQWWALRTCTLSKIVDFLEENKNFSIFFKDALTPDELFFQTAIANIYKTNGASIKPKIVYLRWKDANDLSPKTFLTNDISEIKRASLEKLFARKFDQYLDSEIMDKIDLMISQKSEQ